MKHKLIFFLLLSLVGETKPSDLNREINLYSKNTKHCNKPEFTLPKKLFKEKSVIDLIKEYEDDIEDINQDIKQKHVIQQLLPELLPEILKKVGRYNSSLKIGWAPFFVAATPIVAHPLRYSTSLSRITFRCQTHESFNNGEDKVRKYVWGEDLSNDYIIPFGYVYLDADFADGRNKKEMAVSLTFVNNQKDFVLNLSQVFRMSSGLGGGGKVNMELGSWIFEYLTPTALALCYTHNKILMATQDNYGYENADKINKLQLICWEQDSRANVSFESRFALNVVDKNFKSLAFINESNGYGLTQDNNFFTIALDNNNITLYPQTFKDMENKNVKIDLFAVNTFNPLEIIFSSGDDCYFSSIRNNKITTKGYLRNPFTFIKILAFTPAQKDFKRTQLKFGDDTIFAHYNSATSCYDEVFKFPHYTLDPNKITCLDKQK